LVLDCHGLEAVVDIQITFLCSEHPPEKNKTIKRRKVNLFIIVKVK